MVSDTRRQFQVIHDRDGNVMFHVVERLPPTHQECFGDKDAVVLHGVQDVDISVAVGAGEDDPVPHSAGHHQCLLILREREGEGDGKRGKERLGEVEERRLKSIQYTNNSSCQSRTINCSHIQFG